MENYFYLCNTSIVEKRMNGQLTDNCARSIDHLRLSIGIAEAIRAFGKEHTPYSILSREAAGIKWKTLIINLPGITKAVTESLYALFPGILHAYHMIWGEGHSNDVNEE